MTAFKSLDAIVEQIAFYISQLNSGKLSATDIDSLLLEVNQLQERLIILRYKAYESSLAIEDAVNFPPTAIETPIDFSIKAEPTLVAAPVPTPVVEAPVETPKAEVTIAESEPVADPKQVSLMDVINEAMNKTPDTSSSLTEMLHRAASHTTPAPAPVATLDAAPAPEVARSIEIPAVVAEAPAPVSVSAAAPAQSNARSSIFGGEEVRLAERLQKSPIEDLRSAIPLNLKFLFINDLFKQNAEAFQTAIEKINQSDDLEEAMIYIKSNLISTYGWSIEDKNVEQFLDLVERRFL